MVTKGTTNYASSLMAPFTKEILHPQSTEGRREGAEILTTG